MHSEARSKRLEAVSTHPLSELLACPASTGGLLTVYDGGALPAPGWCDPSLAQTPHRGMLAAMGDGSVRTISASVDVSVYWGAVTPAGGCSCEAM